MFFPPALIASALFAAALAAPARNIVLKKRDSVTAVSASMLSSFAPFTQFARAAYCASSKVQNWQCGEACDALPGFQPTLTGGDGSSVQLFFVGYWPDQDTVVVSHEGTDPTKLEADLTDINIDMTTLDPSLFPGVPDGVQTHEGFTDEHAQTAGNILNEVRNLMSQHGTNSVTLIGHSLGGALAELDSLFMRLNLPNATVKGVTYGTPRVGNDDFVAFFNAQVPDFTRVTNEHDLVPIVPGRFLGFQHPHGEVHLISPGNAVACSAGDDNDSDQCIVGAVGNVFDGSIDNHLGPYEGISLGRAACV
ncbi:alpha/beta-hydrolase [Amylostereum chailletii]|nr:alpha/beta-hydrolase [Amylostereum chailletii]